MKKNKYYLRFKDIPKNEKSNIYCGDQGIVGEEIGVSCIELNNDRQPIIPFTIDDSVVKYDKGVISFINDFSWMLDDFLSKRITAYIVTGDEVGIGSDSEPLLKNVEIITKLNSEPTFIVEKETINNDLIVSKTEFNRETIIDCLKKIQQSMVLDDMDTELITIYELIDKL